MKFKLLTTFIILLSIVSVNVGLAADCVCKLKDGSQTTVKIYFLREYFHDVIHFIEAKVGGLCS